MFRVSRQVIARVSMAVVLIAGLAASLSAAAQSTQNRWPPTPPPGSSAPPAPPTSAPTAPTPAQGQAAGPGRAAAPAGQPSTAPDGGALATFFPAVRTAPAPEWVKQGTRLTFYSAAASLQGSYFEYTPDAHGGFDDRQGHHYGRTETSSGGSGEGYIQVNVARLTPNTAALDLRIYGIVGGPSPRLVSAAAAVAPAGGMDYWMNPGLLATLPDVQRDGLTILHGQFTLGGRQYKSVRIMGTTTSSKQSWVFDTDSGVLLYAGSATQGANSPLHQAGETIAGGTLLTETFLVNQRNVNLPWSMSPAPPWVARTPTLGYDGNISMRMPGSPAFPMKVSVTYQLRSQGPDWFRYGGSQVMPAPAGMPSLPTPLDRVFGPAQIGGVWIAPEILATLRTGQVLDRDAITGVTTSVGAMTNRQGGSMVSILEVNGLQRTEYGYDRATGIQLFYGQTEQMSGMQMLIQLQLTRRQ